jgi:hypothetical protein
MALPLSSLLDPDFSAIVGSLPTPAAVRRYLARSPQIAELRQALTTGELTEEATKEFVNTLMTDFQRGTSFSHEPALSAICVAFETRETNFADEYITDLARLELAELATAIRVARLSLEERRPFAKSRATGHVIGAHEAPQTPIQESRN